MNNDLKLALVQSILHWEDPAANRNHHAQLISGITDQPDIIVLCEMFTTGFTMNTGMAEAHHPHEMQTLQWMHEQSKKYNAVITGSVAVSEAGLCYNRLYWVRPDGLINTYDKRHTFTFAGEHKSYHPGQSRIIEEWRGWKICPLICYDLRFPVWSRNRIEGGEPVYDILVYVANWPEARRDPWSKLLPARAIENQCYLAAVNRVGADQNGLTYSGDSVAYSPKGELLAACSAYQEEVVSVTFNAEELNDFRKKFPVLFDADDFSLSERR
jgi:omega-amidase